MSEDKEKRKAKDYLVRAGERGEEMLVRHPLNPESEVFYTALSDRVGMKRAQLALGRIPPGKVMIAQPDLLYLVDEEALEKKTLEEWIAESQPAKDEAPADD